MSSLDIDADDVPYLESIEHTSFTPIGWLYQSVMEGLVARGLANHTTFGGYILSYDGAKRLAEWRARKL